MKLLITTQAVDTEDPILGFFVRWIEEFSKHAEHVDVICLKEGKYHLPTNVRVHSLGKERGTSNRLVYALRFYRFIWRLRRNYDTVFVHMNPEYVVLGGPFWRLTGKRIGFWYNHPHVGARFRIAERLSHLLFFTSPYAAPVLFPKAKRMPAGIDTELFKPQPVSHDRQLVYIQGRITHSKRIHLALEALRTLRKTIPARLMLVGPEDFAYGEYLRKRFVDLVNSGAVVFAGPKSNAETPALYAAAGVSVNLAAAGHFDKSVLESMACGTPAIVSSPAFADLIPNEWIAKENDFPDLAAVLRRLIALPETEYYKLTEELRKRVIAKHSLAQLGEQLIHALQ